MIMKKNFTRFISVALLSCGVAFTACNNNDPAEPLTYNSAQTATIKGKVLVNADETATPEVWSAAPAGIVIEASIPNSSIYGNQAAGEYRARVGYNATTGEYSATVPVGYNGSPVTITVKDFLGTVKVTENGAPVDCEVVWHSATTSATLEPGDVVYERNIEFEGQGAGAGQYTKIVDKPGSEI